MVPTEAETPDQHDQIIPRVIEDEMKTAYVTYAMSVIVGRALPDVRDGLKPVHRRILYAMYDMGMLHNRPFKKCARIVGEVLGKYHPHGDTAVYDSLVRMAQEFSLRNPLIHGQGNFGSIDGDNAAAMRYTEAKLKKLAEEMLRDIEKKTVDFKDNFDGSLQEPSVLPSKLPNLLINGSSGIAVGMATNIPPHNLHEICSGSQALIANPDITTEELMKHIPAPDFPTGGIVSCGSLLHHAYEHGKGKVTIKSVCEVQDTKIIITEIPYQVNKEQLIIHIAHLVRDKIIPGIRNINDESDKDGIRVVVDLKQGIDGNIVLNQLFKHSRLKLSFGINMLALVDNKPRMLGLKSILHHHINHRKEIITRRTTYDLDQAEKRIHVLQGLLTAIDNIDAVIAGIKRSQNVEEARAFLINTYSLSEIQAKAILDMRLQKLAALEQDKIRAEHNEILEKIAYLKSILESEQKILDLINQDFEDIKQAYGDARRSQVVIGGDDDVDIEDLIEETTVVVTMTNSGYVKRLPIDTYKTQKRGGKGVKAAGMKDEDFIERLYVTSTHDYLLCFTDKGQVYWIKVWQLPEGSRQSKGKHIANALELREGENINAIIPVRNFEEGYLFMGTKQGTVKKTELKNFSRPRKGGIRAISLDDGDELIGVNYTTGDHEIILATRLGRANRFREKDVRAMGRSARGVRGIRLIPNDEVIGMLAADEAKLILTLTQKGFGKKTPVYDYRLCGRGGKGVTNIKITEKNGPVESVKLVDGSEELMLISKQGIGIRVKCKGISTIGRATQGVRVMRMSEGDTLGAAAKIIPEDDDEVLEDAEMVVNEEEGNVEVPEVSVADVEENAEVVVEEASEVPELEEEDTEEPEVEESEDNFTL
ncbi:DNA gyrase subunit A [Candidatus Woesearchaeota archaeon]|mgnify:CR=1 FL=1|jgi:DNA gyrase subunit A|nr:DNA gyrase subunit A [Candidatus Woesearchaeota archaeon]MBT4150801.1 DNA gyrase subunit A [Candidatus Woesearchaeota archaeon]MBT4246906.1 DNA gyrase subunit A [Candidatus Woesearchaeota archaeon]MBT4433591.1 DNA gyrase subunit A [Candidatus Woesearchaeota archaeon]